MKTKFKKDEEDWKGFDKEPKKNHVAWFPEENDCETCKGLGEVHGYDCPDCEGYGG